MEKKLRISGTFNLDNKTDSFVGTITFNESENSIYYTWNLLDNDGKLIGAKSLTVPFQQIPAGVDRFEFTQDHAIQGIKNYRIGRTKIIQELKTIRVFKTNHHKSVCL